VLTLVSDRIYQAWQSTGKTSVSPSGWLTGNAVCCTHRGETPDTKHRGGLLRDNTTGGVVYHCFNCNFAASYTPGKALSIKMKALLSWMGMSSTEIGLSSLEAIRVREWAERFRPDLEIPSIVEPEEISFEEHELPKTSLPITAWLEYYAETNSPVSPDLLTCINYITSRKINIEKYNFHWAPDSPSQFIIPFEWQDKYVGYTTRFIDHLKYRYINSVDGGYVFNTKNQYKRKVTVLVEGPFDAMSVDGIAVLRNTISEKQSNIIDSIGNEIIVVPDNDHAGGELIKYALKFGWSVSFPFWFEDKSIKDVNDATKRYGSVFVLKSILDGAQTSSVKIQLMQKKFGLSTKKK